MKIKYANVGKLKKVQNQLNVNTQKENGYQMLTHIGKYVKIVEKKFQEQEQNILLKMENVKTVVMVAHIAK